MIVTVKWLACDVCTEPMLGHIGTNTNARDARHEARTYYKRRGGKDVCLGCIADMDGEVAIPDSKHALADKPAAGER